MEMKGFFIATVSPFTSQNRLNRDALAQLIDRTIGQGASGMLVAGSSGECFMLSPEERIQSFEAATAFRDRASLMANVSAIGTDEAIMYGERAQELGFHSLVATAPFYYKFSMQAIADFFRDIRRAVDLPLFLYNFPVNTGVDIDIEHPAIREILTDGTVYGLKQTSLNAAQMERIGNLNPELRLFGGYDEMYLANRAMGACGAIGSTFNFTLPLFTPIDAAFRAGDLARAHALQRRANDVVFLLGRCGLIPAIKYALSRQGIAAGECRRPISPLTAEHKAALDQMLEEAFNER